MSFFDKMIEVAKSMGVKDFSYYKKWALDHLKKQLKEEDTVTKALEYCEEYMEKAYGVGTIRTWKGKKYIKGPDKKWRRYFDKHDRGANQAIKNIMREINSLENGDVEGLYAIIQKNQGRFRDENGNVLPEVQQIHDLVEKKQSGTTEKNSKVEEKKDVSKMGREEKESEINTKIENYLKEEKQKKDKELNISDSDINSLTDIDYLKDLQKKVVKENNRLHAEKKYDKANDMARRNYVISDRIKQLESEQEKHDNRSNAMKGNQNAKKDGISDEDEKELKINVDGVKNAIKGKSEIEVKKYFNWAEKRFADKPENSIERRAIARAKAEYYGDTVFENKNIEKGIKEVATNDKVKKTVKDTTVEDFCSKNMDRYLMTGVYNDPDGYKVATDGRMLYAEKTDISEDESGKIIDKKGQEIVGNFPNWKRVIPEDAPKTDLFDNKKELLKLCLLGNKISKLNKKEPCKIKIGKHYFDTSLLSKVIAIAEKQGLNDVTITDRGQVTFTGDKGIVTVMSMNVEGMPDKYLDANDKMYYGEQSDEIKEFLGTEKDRFDPKLEEETKQIDKEESLKAEKYAKEVAEKNKEYEKYDMRLGYHKIHGNWYYTVDSKIDGRWIEGGHNYVTTKATAESIAERTYARKKQAAEYDQINKERIEREEKAKQERVEGYGTFLSGKDAKTKAREMAQLEKRVNFGNGKVMSYKEYIDEQFANGDLDVGTHEENKLKGPSRRAYNRMDGRQQEEYERRIKDAGKKTVYEIKSKSKSGYYELGKIAYDYAKYLIDNGGIKKSFLEQIEEISKSMNKAEPKHDLEYYKKWALSILDKQKEEPEEEDEPNEETIVKALAYTEMIAKAGYPVGTIREWKGQKYIKIAPNKWKPKYDNMGSRGAKMSLTNLKKAVAKCNSEEDLFNLINSNASRFRDENGNPFPEVQELHDMIGKRQNEMNSSQPSNELENTSDGKSDGGKENGGKEEKKGDKKMKYSDKIAAIQNAGNKVVSETNKLAAGRPEDVATDAGDSAVNSVKTAAKDQEKKPVAAQNVLTPSDLEKDSEKEIEGAVTDSQTTEKVLSKYMGDNNPGETRKREGNKETVWGNDYTKKHKLEFKQNMAGVVLGKPQMDQELFEELSKYDVNSDSHLLAPKYGLEGAEFLNLVSKVREDRVNIVDSGSKKETFESLTEKYNATKDPDEREKILNKIMSLEKEKNDTIKDMKEETYEDMGYSEKTKEEIDNMDRAEFSEYMRREQKSIPMDKIGRGGGRITNFDNAYNVCKKIAETYGVSDEGVKKLQDFMTYNTDTASRLHDELNEKMGMSYELLDADYDMAYKNALKQLLGKKTNGDSDKEKAAVDKYHNNLGAAAKKYL